MKEPSPNRTNPAAIRKPRNQVDHASFEFAYVRSAASKLLAAFLFHDSQTAAGSVTIRP
jgi:hypothetical protein